jgi:hypothetical protein
MGELRATLGWRFSMASGSAVATCQYIAMALFIT